MDKIYLFVRTQVIHTTPVHQLTSCEYLFHWNFSSEKVVSSDSGEKYAQIKHRLQAKTKMSVDFDVKGQQGMDFFNWRKRYYELWMDILSRIGGLKLKCLNDGFVSYKHATFHFTTGVVWIACGLLWCFISCLDSHSDGTHSLLRIHWWTSDVMLHYSKSVLMKKQTHLHLGWPELNCQQILFLLRK